MNLEEIFNFSEIKEFIYFVSSPEIQGILLPVKVVFIFFSLFFLAAVIYFMFNSTWMRYKFLEDTFEFFSWKSYGTKQIEKTWAKIKSRIDSGIESELKLAIIEADDFLTGILDERGYEEGDFQEKIKNAANSSTLNLPQIIWAHETRNSVVYNPDFKISKEDAIKVLQTYKNAIDSMGSA